MYRMVAGGQRGGGAGLGARGQLQVLLQPLRVAPGRAGQRGAPPSYIFIYLYMYTYMYVYIYIYIYIHINVYT